MAVFKGNKGVFVAFKQYLDGFTHLLFPSNCVVCQTELSQNEKICCSICFSELTLTHFENSDETTELDQLFWGRVPITATHSMLYYEKTNNSKPILTALKYKNRPDVGVFFGRMLGNQLKNNPKFSSIDALIPVPIHRKKRYIRGYNQSEQIVKGIVQTWNVHKDFKILERNKHTGSQTKLNRFNRWDNAEGLFTPDTSINKYKHIALVDDVITTGSTLEAITKRIFDVAPEIKVSIISLALAK
ncbi:MAG: hypothetical protein M9916_09255 [Crocinitomicaceae bacterium]|nr:hypothetical protein [Crocinitomicaceae bacterium]